MLCRQQTPVWNTRAGVDNTLLERGRGLVFTVLKIDFANCIDSLNKYLASFVFQILW